MIWWRRDRAAEFGELAGDAAVLPGGVRLAPRLADLRDGPEARAFFAEDSSRMRCWNFSACFLVRKDLRCRLSC